MRAHLSLGSSARFSWLSILAPVEIQLVMRCLNVRSRLSAARCNKQLYAAANHSFAWAQDQMATLRVDNNAATLQSLAARVRGSLLRLAPIHLRVLLPATVFDPLCPELFAVPNVQAITAQVPLDFLAVACLFLLPLLLHPAAQQLRSLDISGIWNYECTEAELHGLATLPHLHSLFLSDAIREDISASLPPSSLYFSSLTHLKVFPSPLGLEKLFASLSHCPRLTSLELQCACIDTALFHCLAWLPPGQLQRLRFWRGEVDVMEEPPTSARAALGSLPEIELDEVDGVNLLLPVLSSAPALRLFRWRCDAPQWMPTPNRPFCLPSLEPLRQLMTEAPQVQVQLVLSHSFDQWLADSDARVLKADESDALLHFQRHCWNELQQLLSQPELSGVCRIDVESGDD